MEVDIFGETGLDEGDRAMPQLDQIVDHLGVLRGILNDCETGRLSRCGCDRQNKAQETCAGVSG